jgi:hypothetical protein
MAGTAKNARALSPGDLILRSLAKLTDVADEYSACIDRLCGLVVRVLDYRSRGPGFDSWALPEKKNNGSGTGSTQPREYN